MGISIDALIPTAMVIRGAAQGSRLDVKGVVFLEVVAPGPANTRTRVPQQFFVAQNCRTTYLSHRALIDLGVISPEFPRVGEVDGTSGSSRCEGGSQGAARGCSLHV